MEDLQLLVEDQIELHGGFIEDRAEKHFVGAERARGRLHAAQVIEREDDALAFVGDAIDEIFDLLDRHAMRCIEHDVLDWRIVVPLRGVLEIAEVGFALIAVAGIEPDIAGIADAVEIEAEVVIVLSRKHLHAFGQLRHHKAEHRHLVLGVELEVRRRRAQDSLDVTLVGLERRALLGVCGSQRECESR